MHSALPTALPGAIAWDRIFDFSDYGALLALVHNSLYAGALLGLIGGLVGVFIVARDLPFAVHGIAELSFAGAAFALLIGVNVVLGSLVGSVLAAVLFGVLGTARASTTPPSGCSCRSAWAWGCCSWRCTRGGPRTSSAC